MPIFKVRFFRLLLCLTTISWPIYGFNVVSTNLSNLSSPVKWALSKQCTLKVNGSTNINKFSCVIPEYELPDTLTIGKETNRQRVKISGSMVLGVQKFDCKNPMMTSDLRKILKAKSFPRLIITFEDLSSYPDPANPGVAIKGFVTIELAGAVKRFEVDYQYVMAGEKRLRITGTKTLHFSDFNIVPPKRLGGMIKTNNELNVEFMLNIKILN